MQIEQILMDSINFIDNSIKYDLNIIEGYLFSYKSNYDNKLVFNVLLKIKEDLVNTRLDIYSVKSENNKISFLHSASTGYTYDVLISNSKDEIIIYQRKFREG